MSRNKGFFFLGGVDLTNNPGSGDLGYVIEHANLRRIDKVGTADAHVINEDNRQKITERLSVAILVRYAIHEKLEKDVLKREMTPYEWLLYQLYPKKFLGREDLFLDAVECILVNHQAVMTMKHLNPTQFRGKNTTWSVFLDEAQDLISHPQRSGMNHFQSSNGKCRRSSFSAIVDGFSRQADPDRAGQQLYYPVFSGTGLEFDQFQEEARSIAAKGLQLRNLTTSDIVFGDFQVLTADDTKKYLKKFLNLSDVSESVIAHISEWLRGRPRWVASFIEVYVSRGGIDNFHLPGIKANSSDLAMMEALDRYLKVMTAKFDDTKRRRTWNAGEKSAYTLFRKTVKRGNSDDSDEQTGPQVYFDLLQAVGKFAGGNKSHVFADAKAQFLIEKGISTVRVISDNGSITGSFDEPIINEAGMNYFGLDKHLRNNIVNQEDGGLGQAVEKLLLMGMMKSKETFRAFLQSHLKEDAEDLKSFLPPTKTAYGVLCVETGTDIGKILKWIKDSMNAEFEGQVPPFCLPDTSVGPDVVCLLRHALSYRDFRSCMIQSKFVSDKPNQMKAILTLVSDLLYHQNRGKDNVSLSNKLHADDRAEWQSLKDDFISDVRPCLRIYVHTTDNKSTQSGMVAADAASPVPAKTGKKNDQWLIVLNNEHLNDAVSDSAVKIVRALKKPRTEESNQMYKSMNNGVTDRYSKCSSSTNLSDSTILRVNYTNRISY